MWHTRVTICFRSYAPIAQQAISRRSSYLDVEHCEAVRQQEANSSTGVEKIVSHAGPGVEFQASSVPAIDFHSHLTETML